MIARAMLATLALLTACRGRELPLPSSPPPVPPPAVRAPRPDGVPAWNPQQHQPLYAADELTAADGDPLRGLAALRPVEPDFLAVAVTLGGQVAGALRVRAADRWCGLGDLATIGTPVLGASTFVGLVHVDRPVSAATAIHEGLPWAAMAAVHHDRTRATVWIDRRRRWYDAVIDVDVGRERELLFETAILDDDDVVEISEAGRPLWWTRVGYWLRVERGLGFRPHARLRFHLRGPLGAGDDWMTAEVARLDRVLPVVPGARPVLDVTIHVPDGDRVDAVLPATPAPSAPGWRAWRIRGRGDRLGAVVQAGVTPRTIDRGGVRWTVIGPPAIDRAIERAADALAPLGPPTERAVRLVAFAPGDHAHAPRAGLEPAVLAAWTGADPVVDQHAIATAVAARWLAAAPDATHQPCAWQDAAAAAIGLWTLDAGGARAIRSRWAALAADVSPFRLSYPGPSLPEIRVELCARGALLWAALDDQLGRAAVIGFVRRLRSAGPSAGWSDVAALAPALRAWIDRPLLPIVGLTRVERTAAGLTATLLQNPLAPIDHCDDFTARDLTVPPYRGPITVAARAGAREIARVEVDLGLDPVPIHFAADPSITVLVVDPDARLPLAAGPALAVAVPP